MLLKLFILYLFLKWYNSVEFSSKCSSLPDKAAEAQEGCKGDEHSSKRPIEGIWKAKQLAGDHYLSFYVLLVFLDVTCCDC